ncbi:MAG: polysaccharide pyruvyl transferase CsaB [Cyanobacteria bacterium K_Offshore_0m_m2_072]|nr:polysaccharide pyruvyl transferase CsaB [Cyanobacteria bacterium K_Offshore_0m_m2_072]
MLLCGYYGEHNLGDDALLEVLLAQLPAATPVLVTAHDQPLVQQRFGVATVDRRSLAAVLGALGRCRALVLGGGSLLQEATSFNSLLYYAALITAARLQGKPVVLWGQGLGPLRRRRSRWLVRGLLPLVTSVCWRDPASAQLAAALGRPGDHGADPVWASAPVPWGGRGQAIVICWRPTPLLQGAAWTPWLEALDRLATEADRAVLWLPFHQDQDTDLLAQLQAQGLISASLGQRSRLLAADTPQQAKAIFAHAALVLSMRLHGLILAAVSGAPCAALSYDPKVQAAAEALGCPCQSLDHPANASDLLALWRGQLGHPPDPARLALLRSQGLRHAALLDSL